MRARRGVQLRTEPAPIGGGWYCRERVHVRHEPGCTTFSFDVTVPAADAAEPADRMRALFHMSLSGQWGGNLPPAYRAVWTQQPVGRRETEPLLRLF